MFVPTQLNAFWLSVFRMKWKHTNATLPEQRILKAAFQPSSKAVIYHIPLNGIASLLKAQVIRSFLIRLSGKVREALQKRVQAGNWLCCLLVHSPTRVQTWPASYFATIHRAWSRKATWKWRTLSCHKGMKTSVKAFHASRMFDSMANSQCSQRLFGNQTQESSGNFHLLPSFGL